MKERKISPTLSRILPFLWWFVLSILVVVVSLLSGSLERRTLADIIDRSLKDAGDSRRIGSSVPNWGPDGVASLAGERFILEKNAGTVIVFTVNGSGASVTLAALFSSRKTIDLVLPLGEGSRRALPRLPAGLVDAYKARILESEKIIDQRKQAK